MFCWGIYFQWGMYIFKYNFLFPSSMEDTDCSLKTRAEQNKKMENKQNIKKAVESAEQEIQEKEIANLKAIIKSLLEKKMDKEKDKREIEKEISVIKQTIDDFKAGRLDKIKEMQEKDSIANSVLPFKIIIINQPVITQPWGWHYQVVPNYPIWNSSQTLTSGGTNTVFLSGTAGSSTAQMYTSASATLNNANFTGSNFGTFASGVYNLGGGAIVNL